MKNTIMFITIICICTVQMSQPEVCKLIYKGFPEDIQNKTIVVPENMVAFSNYLFVGSPFDSIQNLKATPSIFFIIDHSGTMCFKFDDPALADCPQDRWGNRFTVLHDLLDILYKKYPKAEVGFAVFRQNLYFNKADGEYFEQCPQHDSGAYVPLLKLDSTYAPDGKLGYQILKSILVTDTVKKIDDPLYEYVDLRYKPSGGWPDDTLPLTHINAGFDAAKHAISFSKNKKQNQYIIFLSDGSATYPTNNKLKKQYVKGTDVPTTFTVFFTKNNQTPLDIINMTENIQQNGYSSSNPKSNCWPFNNTEYDTLMNFLVDNVISKINLVQTSKPIKIIFNKKNPITPFDGKGFAFAALFPLTGKTTNFQANIDYKISEKTINDIGDTIIIQKDTTVDVQFTIEISKNGSIPDHFDSKCWDRELALYYNNKPITSINEKMDTLEVRFTEIEVDTLYGYNAVSIQLENAKGSLKDKEVLKLEEIDTYFSNKFSHEINTSPQQGDNILQHHPSDSVVMIYRNPKLILDTLHIAIPIECNGTTAMTGASYFDNEKNYADGFIDSILVNYETSLVDGLTPSHLKEILDNSLLKLPASRNFTIKNFFLLNKKSFALLVKENSNTPRTNVNSEDKIVISDGILQAGGLLKASEISVKDMVAPVIVQAHFNPRIENTETSKILDTLIITLSEPVKEIIDPKPFIFYDINSSKKYSMNLTTFKTEDGDKRHVFHVNSSEKEFPQDGDSVRIFEQAQVSDHLENIQNNSHNRRVRLTVKPYPFNIEFLAYPNPWNPEKSTVLDGKNYGNKLLLYVHIVNGGISHLEYTAYFSMYDAMGNLLLDNIQVQSKNKKNIIYAWSGTNMANRDIGINNYMACVRVENSRGRTIESRISIGIKVEK